MELKLIIRFEDVTEMQRVTQILYAGLDAKSICVTNDKNDEPILAMEEINTKTLSNDKICKQCGKTHTREKSEFCSTRCYMNAWYRDHHPKHDIFREKVAKEPKICVECGKQFIPFHKDAQYCGRECNQAKYRKNRDTKKSVLVPDSKNIQEKLKDLRDRYPVKENERPVHYREC